MTPRETYLSIDAAIWRDERRQRLELRQAWATAMLTRAKKIPPFKRLLGSAPSKPLKGAELRQRREEFARMTAKLDLAGLKQDVKDDGIGGTG